MNAARLKDTGDGFVRLRLPKGVLLVFTHNEYVQALQRGKRERRAQRLADHHRRQRARQDSAPLAWITEE